MNEQSKGETKLSRRRYEAFEVNIYVKLAFEANSIIDAKPTKNKNINLLPKPTKLITSLKGRKTID